VATSGDAGAGVEETRRWIDEALPERQHACEVTPMRLGIPFQRTLLQRAGTVDGWIREGGVLARIRNGPGAPEGKVDAMFLAALSRLPRPSERARFVDIVAAGEGGFEDAYRVLLNTLEFNTRH
jgi:hypothetical protein